MQKRILFLGGSQFQVSPIIYARQQGHYVITCDYLPDNPGHRFAHEYYNISTIDKEAVLQLAKNLNIDGIAAIASDASAPTAAYVANYLNLPGNPYEAACILTRKDLFRNFLSANNFNVPLSASFSSLQEAQKYYNGLGGAVMVKPVDASGSKGVSKAEHAGRLPAAFDYALSCSRANKVIIEEYIERKGYQIAGDGFVVDGRLVFRCFAQEHFNNNTNPFLPVGESFPLQLSEILQNKIHSEIDRLMSLLKMKCSGLNFDIMINEQEEIYLMEVAARSGGNFISKVIKYSTGIDLDKYAVDIALGLDCSSLTMYDSARFYSSYMLNAKKDGIYKGLVIDPSVRPNIVEQLFFVKEGMPVESFKNASCAIGCVILTFSTAAEMLEKMESMDERIQVIVG